MVPLIRRHQYRASILRGDYFVLKHLSHFLDAMLREWVRPGAVVGDVGCGEQPLRDLITKLGGKYVGLDVQQNARGTVQILADITDVPVSDACFDVVLCSEVLEHVADTTAAFAELARVCKRGGSVILTTPFAYPLHEEPHDFVRLTPYHIRKAARSNSLDVVHLITSGNELQVIATVWCNMWSRAGSHPRGRIRTAWNVLMRLPVNALANSLTPLLRPVLPHKYFLNTLCVLVKSG